MQQSSLRPICLLRSHDASSTTSLSVLNELKARARPPSVIPGPFPAGSGAEGSSQDSNHNAPIRKYLDEASSPVPTQDALFELDVIDRRRATPDQWRTVGAYLRQSRPSQIEALKDETGPIVVNWDDGEAVQNIDGVRRMIEKLEQESGRNEKASGKRDDSRLPCLIM